MKTPRGKEQQLISQGKAKPLVKFVKRITTKNGGALAVFMSLYLGLASIYRLPTHVSAALKHAFCFSTTRRSSCGPQNLPLGNLSGLGTYDSEECRHHLSLGKPTLHVVG